MFCELRPTLAFHIPDAGPIPKTLLPIVLGDDMFGDANPRCIGIGIPLFPMAKAPWFKSFLLTPPTFVFSIASECCLEKLILTLGKRARKDCCKSDAESEDDCSNGTPNLLICCSCGDCGGSGDADNGE